MIEFDTSLPDYHVGPEDELQARLLHVTDEAVDYLITSLFTDVPDPNKRQMMVGESFGMSRVLVTNEYGHAYVYSGLELPVLESGDLLRWFRILKRDDISHPATSGITLEVQEPIMVGDGHSSEEVLDLLAEANRVKIDLTTLKMRYTWQCGDITKSICGGNIESLNEGKIRDLERFVEVLARVSLAKIRLNPEYLEILAADGDQNAVNIRTLPYLHLDIPGTSFDDRRN